ncbi:transposase [Cetobacterium sp.]|uniref:transposase n=1 Tax=Cetobacterium sp. TaxID=2071632 RepID=UPI003F410809
MIEGELGYTKYDCRNKDSNNSRNGYNSKKLKSSAGEIEVNVPRDINDEYEPQVIKKYQNTIGQELEAKIISMDAKGILLVILNLILKKFTVIRVWIVLLLEL